MGDATASPLCVDLDGTLIDADLGFKSLFLGVVKKPWLAFHMVGWLAAGKQVLKHHLAQVVDIDVTRLSYNDTVLDYLQAQRDAGRPVFLVTGSHHKYARAIYEHLQCFDGVMASDETINLTGSRKANLLVEKFGQGKFEYIGNDKIDLKVWRHAATATLFNVSAPVKAQAQALGVELGVVVKDLGSS